MVSDEQISLWKKQYGNIFSATFGGIDYIFRELTFSEYDDVFALGVDAAEAEDYLVSLVLLHPFDLDFDDLSAGVVTSLAEEILEISGFGSPQTAKEILEKHREETNQVRGLMKAFVLAAMSAYKEEELDSLTFNQLAKKVALAEKVIEVNQAAFGVENEILLDIIDPEEEALAEQRAAMKHAAQKKPGEAGYNDPIARKLREALG